MRQEIKEISAGDGWRGEEAKHEVRGSHYWGSLVGGKKESESRMRNELVFQWWDEMRRQGWGVFAKKNVASGVPFGDRRAKKNY